MIGKSTTEFIPVSSFDIHALKQAFQEGRLYIKQTTEEKTETTIREEGIRSILQYVSHINECASEKYLSNIHQLWNRILHSSELEDLFFLNRYKNTRGQPNWYRVNVVMAFLLEQNVYCKNTYTAMELHMKMEQTDKRTKFYTGMGRYLLENKERSILKKML